MKPIECTACGSKELADDGNQVICLYCQSRFVADTPVVTAAAPAVLATEQTEFDVVLMDIGRKKMKLTKVVTELTGLGIRDAVKLLEARPPVVLRGVNTSRAEAAKAQLEGAGATVSIQ